MSVSINFPFDDELNYNFDPSKIEISGSKARLKLQSDPVSFAQGFDSSAGFTFDPLKSEIVGGELRQIDKRPAGATFYAPFNTDNAAWGGGSLVATMHNGAAAVGGELDLSGTAGAASAKYADYPALNNADSALQGTIRFRVKSGGAPLAGLKYLFHICGDIGGAASSRNMILLTHNSSGGYIGLRIMDANSLDIIPTTNIVTGWQFTLGTWYEFELNYDLVNGATRLFINGIQVGSTITTVSSARTNVIDRIRIGNTFGIQNNCNNFYDYFMVFSTVQHTANYTPSIPVEDTIYLHDAITLPAFSYAGAGHITAFTDFGASVSGAPRFIVNGLYHNGTAWISSDDSYAQANTAAQILSAISSLPASDTIIVKVSTDSSNIIQSVSALAIDAAGQIYPVDNPSISPTSSFRNEGIVGLVAIASASGSDAIKYTLSKNGTPYYHNGTAWTASNGSYSQTNTAAEIIANAESFTSEAVNTIITSYLHSAAGLTTPDVDDITIEYDYAGEAPSPIDVATVWGYTADFIGSAEVNIPIKVSLDPKTVFYKNRIFTPKKVTVLSNSIGYFEIDLAETTNMSDDPYYIIKIGSKTLRVKIPTAEKIALTEL